MKYLFLKRYLELHEQNHNFHQFRNLILFSIQLKIERKLKMEITMFPGENSKVF